MAAEVVGSMAQWRGICPNSLWGKGASDWGFRISDWGFGEAKEGKGGFMPAQTWMNS